MTCNIIGCEKSIVVKGMCRSHYDQVRYNRPVTLANALKVYPPCEFPVCDRYAAAYKGGFCSTHNTQLRRGKELTVIGETHGKLRPVQHGTPSTYTNHACRCDLCRIAWNSYQTGVRKGQASVSHQRKSPKSKPGLESRKGVCDCCHREARRLVWDHDHVTGLFRGYICDSCNTGIGKLGDTIEGIRLAEVYLSKPPGEE